MGKSNVACLAGHSTKNLPWRDDEYLECCYAFKDDLKDILVNAINYGVNTFLTGLSEGFDMIATEILLNLKYKYNLDIKIIAVIAFEKQYINFSAVQQAKYTELLQICDEKIILNNQYTKDSFRNKYKFMVLNSNFCIACWNGKPSMTGNIVRFAKENGCRVRLIDINRYYF